MTLLNIVQLRFGMWIARKATAWNGGCRMMGSRDPCQPT
jgi:hypothetical protein